tara:strand:+ start:1870 stop:2100 length:231 start_codon:yes stop_codon:yes gene_type:complete
MDNTMNQVGVSAINAAPIAQQPVYNKAIGSPMGVQRTPADPTGQVSNAVATDLNFNPNTKDMALMMYGGNKSRGIK